MAFVHPHSCECIKSELDIFAVPPTQTSIKHGQYVEYNPIAAIALGQPIEFNISGGGQDYLDLGILNSTLKRRFLDKMETLCKMPMTSDPSTCFFIRCFPKWTFP